MKDVYRASSPNSAYSYTHVLVSIRQVGSWFLIVDDVQNAKSCSSSVTVRKLDKQQHMIPFETILVPKFCLASSKLLRTSKTQAYLCYYYDTRMSIYKAQIPLIVFRLLCLLTSTMMQRVFGQSQCKSEFMLHFLL